MQLKSLKRKALLESVGDGSKTPIDMHDLWREFCALETHAGELRRRRWLYESSTDECSALIESSPSGSCWEELKRMAFLDCDLRDPKNASSWMRANFAHFSNVTVLQITGVFMTEKFVLDLSGLIHLKSLEIVGKHLHRLVLQGLPGSLTYLSLYSVPTGHYINRPNTFELSNSRQLIKRIACLERLHYLLLGGFEGAELPDMRNMSSMRCARFSDLKNAVTVTGLSSKLATHLRILVFERLEKLRRCPGVGDLVALEELYFRGCPNLKMLPNLRKLSKLRRLEFSQCPLIIEVPGLDELIALEWLYAGIGQGSTFDKESFSLRLPNMGKLSKLQELYLPGCRLRAVQGLDRLSSLQVLVADFRDLENVPNLRPLTKLQKLLLHGCSSEGLRELDKLTLLNHLWILHSCGVDELPDLRSLIRLRSLSISECEFKNVSSFSTLGALEVLYLYECSSLKIVPDLHRLTRLEKLFIVGCPIEDGTIIGSNQLPGLRTLKLLDCSSLTTLPDLHAFPGLVKLELWGCSRLTRLHCSGPLKALQRLDLRYCISLNALPDLGMFPALKDLVLEGCEELTTLRSTASQLPALKVLRARRCRNLKWNELRRFRLLHCRQMMIDHEFLEY